jgi:hypothetical protein
MMNFYRGVVSLCFVLISSMSFGINEGITPPDTTTSLVDKSAAIYAIEEGKTLYGDGKVRDALIKFRQASVTDPNSWRALYWIGKCHYRMNNYGYALKYEKDALEMGKEKVNKEIYYNLGLAYHRSGILDTAILNYQKAIDLLPKTRSKALLIQHNIDQCNFAKKALENPTKFERVRLVGDVNSGFDDYNVVLGDSANTIYFTSRRSNTTGGGINPDDQRYYEDVYKSVYDVDFEEWDGVTNKLGKMNSNGFDALNFISPDGLWAVLTLNNTMDPNLKKTTRVSDICITKKNKKGTWNTPRAIENKSINTSFFEGAATLTADGNTMYFVTDRKGEKSSTDIYVVEKVGKKWGTAKPLPEQINTTGRETTPYITPDGQYLFFSSNGHDGMGGLDVYVCKNMGGSWSEPVNLGAGINTVNNDTHFVYSAEMKKAFMSGFEIFGNKSSLDIYEIDMTEFQFPQ